MRSIRTLAGGAALATCLALGSVVSAPTAFAAAPDACGDNLADYGGTFVGTVNIGNGPTTLTYTLTFPGTGNYQVQLNVGGDQPGNNYTAAGPLALSGEAGVAKTVNFSEWPMYTTDNNISTQPADGEALGCSNPLPLFGPPTVSQFTIKQDGGPDIIMNRTI